LFAKNVFLSPHRGIKDIYRHRFFVKKKKIRRAGTYLYNCGELKAGKIARYSSEGEMVT